MVARRRDGEHAIAYKCFPLAFHNENAFRSLSVVRVRPQNTGKTLSNDFTETMCVNGNVVQVIPKALVQARTVPAWVQSVDRAVDGQWRDVDATKDRNRGSF